MSASLSSMHRLYGAGRYNRFSAVLFLAQTSDALPVNIVACVFVEPENRGTWGPKGSLTRQRYSHVGHVKMTIRK